MKIKEISLYISSTSDCDWMAILVKFDDGLEFSSDLEKIPKNISLESVFQKQKEHSDKLLKAINEFAKNQDLK